MLNGPYAVRADRPEARVAAGTLGIGGNASSVTCTPAAVFPRAAGESAARWLASFPWSMDSLPWAGPCLTRADADQVCGGASSRSPTRRQAGQRQHPQNIASRRRAGHFRPAHQFPKRGVGRTPVPVAAGDDAECTVLAGRLVQVGTQGHHAFGPGRGSMGVHDLVFHGPGAGQAYRFDATAIGSSGARRCSRSHPQSCRSGYRALPEDRS